MKSPLVLLLVGGLLFGIALSAGCSEEKKADSGSPKASPKAAPAPASTPKGVTLSPKSFQAADFTDFLAKAKQAGRIVSWSGDWNELGAGKGGPAVVAKLAQTNDFIPLIVAQFFTQSSGQPLRPLDDATSRRYKDAAVAFAKEYKPKYLALGIEVNVLYEKSPADFDRFVRLFDEVYDAVKAASPDTRVFTVFQLERLKGLRGGLFGGRNDPGNAQWDLLERFPKADMIGFTTYPGLVFRDPKDIPDDYYTEIAARTAKAVAFTEVGWHSSASPAGWESSEAEQAGFVGRFFGLTRDLKKEMAIWSFMYDQKAIEPFNSMGLRRRDGTARPAWDRWAAGD